MLKCCYNMVNSSSYMDMTSNIVQKNMFNVSHNIDSILNSVTLGLELLGIGEYISVLEWVLM